MRRDFLRLHEYQEHARDFLLTTGRAGLWMECGHGKTAVVLSALTPAHLPALVVAPPRVCEHVWPAERDLWRPDLRLSLATGGPAQRRAALEAESDVYVLSNGSLADAKRRRWRTVVLDESSAYKDRGTARWKAARAVTKDAMFVWELTGTPSPNGLLDLWAQIFLLDRGERLGTSSVAFKTRYFKPSGRTPTGVYYGWKPKPETEKHVHTMLEDICLSIEGRLELPPVTTNTLSVSLPRVARTAYEDLKKEMVANLELLGGEIHTASNAAVLTSKLSQVTSGFIFSDAKDGTYDRLHNRKVEALEEVVEGTGSPLLTFYWFRPELEAIRKAFPTAIHIDEPNALRAWDAGDVPMLLAHPQSAAHGLNLQHGGHTVVWVTTPWALELYLQANARVARQGQRHPVVIHHIDAEESIDQVVRARLEGKEWTQNRLLEHLGIAYPASRY